LTHVRPRRHRAPFGRPLRAHANLMHRLSIAAGGGNKCKPGCACFAHIGKMARTWPEVVRPLRGYSVPMAHMIPNASLDLVYVDAAHDYRNARNDVLAYWPKLKPGGVMAGHDFAHWRNWGEVRHDRLEGRGGWAVAAAAFAGTSGSFVRGRSGKKVLVPPYGVAQATQELFTACHVNVRFNTWWVEKRTCTEGPQQLVSPEEAV
jgi:hypothetical protein